MSKINVDAYECDFCKTKDFEMQEVTVRYKIDTKIYHVCFKGECLTKCLEMENVFIKTIGKERQFILKD